MGWNCLCHLHDPSKGSTCHRGQQGDGSGVSAEVPSLCLAPSDDSAFFEVVSRRAQYLSDAITQGPGAHTQRPM